MISRFIFVIRESVVIFVVFLKLFLFTFIRGGTRILLRRGCITMSKERRNCLFFRRMLVVLESRGSSQGGGVRTPCTLPLDPPLFMQE